LRRNFLLRQVIDGKIKGEIEVTRRRGKDVGSYWMTLRKGEVTHVMSDVSADTNCSVLSSNVVGVVIALYPGSVGPRTGYPGGRVLVRNEAATVMEYLSIPGPGTWLGEGAYGIGFN
jgi:hypothetical protein